MKRLLLFASIFILFGMLSCENLTETPAPGDFPARIKYKVDELSAKSGKSCEYILVMVYEVSGKRYYNIDFAYSSCNDCNLYDKYGNRATQGVLANPNETKVIETRPGCVLPK
jgi:hypothetical protein